MDDQTLVKLLVALALLALNAWACFALSFPRDARRPGTAVVFAPAPAPPVARPKPRILTGEPAPPEPRRSPALRAAKLIAGIMVLGFAGALGILALAKALIALFDRLGG